MKYKVVELEDFTGNAATIYSIIIDDEKHTLFDKFIEENKDIFKSELIDLITKLETIGQITGAREYFFKHDEGELGDGVVALFDDPDSNLRLYCIRYGTQIVILGGGGHKPKDIRAFQDDKKLTSENYQLRHISKQISTSIKEKRIKHSPCGFYLEGELEFQDETDE
jgi:putative component of toxin-antitoxin plasmid stabilization module